MTGTRTGKVIVETGEGEVHLCLRIGELIDLQDKLGLGPQALINRLSSGEWFVQHVVETVYFGLLGGETMKQTEARAWVRRNIKEGYVLDYVPIALTVLYAAMVGAPEDDPVGEPEAALAETATQMSDLSSNGLSSTETPEPPTSA
ncbi:gene transfer agent family protein [Phenylobacterium terrae]|uniref:Gene transfer agent family protein n=1 Tax=Phenylobacterium terrae TaxID=2665495 RepID=A0ABW4N786_9CAUL